VNLLGKNTHIIKENTEGLSATSKEAGLEVNAERTKHTFSFFISNFCYVLNVVFFLLGDSPASEYYVPIFWNIVFHLHRSCEQEE
jgi:hypothetical protein